MVGQEQFHGDLADLAQLRGVDLDVQARFGRGGASALDAASGHFHQAQAAGPVHGQFGVVAKSRQLDAGLADDFQKVALALDGDGAAFDGDELLVHGHG